MNARCCCFEVAKILYLFDIRFDQSQKLWFLWMKNVPRSFFDNGKIQSINLNHKDTSFVGNKLEFCQKTEGFVRSPRALNLNDSFFLSLIKYNVTSRSDNI